jgi:hypothetical protein
VAYASDSKNQGDKDWVTAVTKCPLKLVLYWTLHSETWAMWAVALACWK